MKKRVKYKLKEILIIPILCLGIVNLIDILWKEIPTGLLLVYFFGGWSICFWFLIYLFPKTTFKVELIRGFVLIGILAISELIKSSQNSLGFLRSLIISLIYFIIVFFIRLVSRFKKE